LSQAVWVASKQRIATVALQDIVVGKAHAVKSRLRPLGTVQYKDLLLPPAEVRLGGLHFKDDAAFVASGQADARRLHDAFGVGASSAILDVGCGYGRLPIGLLSEFGGLERYRGIDVAKPSIDWCTKHIAKHNAGAKFIYVNVANARYQRRGRPIDDDFNLPFDDASFDLIYLYSVFSHMETGDVSAYLQEFNRLLTPTGGVFLTAFVEDDVEDIAINPKGYGPIAWEGALHCVRFNGLFFDGLVRDAGFTISRVDHGTETDGQSAIYLQRTGQSE
jgi:SAM-dependent methyltransferase